MSWRDSGRRTRPVKSAWPKRALLRLLATIPPAVQAELPTAVDRALALSGARCGCQVRVELEQVVGSDHEPPFERAADLPRGWKRSIRRLNFVCAKTGSIMPWRLA